MIFSFELESINWINIFYYLKGMDSPLTFSTIVKGYFKCDEKLLLIYDF